VFAITGSSRVGVLSHAGVQQPDDEKANEIYAEDSPNRAKGPGLGRAVCEMWRHHLQQIELLAAGVSVNSLERAHRSAQAGLGKLQLQDQSLISGKSRSQPA